MSLFNSSKKFESGLGSVTANSGAWCQQTDGGLKEEECCSCLCIFRSRLHRSGNGYECKARQPKAKHSHWRHLSPRRAVQHFIFFLPWESNVEMLHLLLHYVGAIWSHLARDMNGHTFGMTPGWLLLLFTIVCYFSTQTWHISDNYHHVVTGNQKGISH